MNVDNNFTKQRSLVISLNNGKNKGYFIAFLDTKNIFMDISIFPKTCFLCACCDGISMIQQDIGKKRKDIRSFVDIEWLINEWGGPKDWVDATVKIKENILNDWKSFDASYEDLEEKDNG